MAKQAPPAHQAASDQRRDVRAALVHPGDRVFTTVITACAFVALLVLAGIAVFLGLQAIPAFQSQGLAFVTTTAWDINTDPPTVGIFGMLYGSSCLQSLASPSPCQLHYCCRSSSFFWRQRRSVEV